jgi:DNA invertase Pin-like site-specific DNA recombinase
MSMETKEPNKPEAVIYVRLASIEPDDKGGKLARQLQLCRDYAATRGYAVVRVFSDAGVSGTTSDRPGTNAMLAYLEFVRGRDTIVLMEDMTRLARDIFIHMMLSTQIEATGAFIEACTRTKLDRVVPHPGFDGTFVWRVLP